MIVWSTKYALTAGIMRCNVRTCDSIGPHLVRLLNKEGGDTSHFLRGEGKEWHRTYEGAYVAAEKMRLNKIMSLKKQIAKLEKLTWTSNDVGS